MIELERLQTEQRNPRTKNIDCLPTLDVVRLLNAEDKTVPLAIEKILPQIAEAADLIADHLAAGGRLFYQGAGTSGRLGILDAVECPPTYRTDPSRIVGLIAGGTTDDGNTSCLIRLKSQGKSHHICTEDTKLSCSTHKHKLGIGNQGGEVGHGSNAEEYQRRIPSLAHTLIEDVEHRVVFI